MSWRIFRRIWITLFNLMCIGLLSVGLLEDYELSSFHGAARPVSASLERFGPMVLVTLLLLGIIFEWLDWKWPALTLNVGFFAIPGFVVLSKALIMVMTKSPAQYHPEAGLAVEIVGVPFTAVALGDLFLYWITRPKAPASLATPSVPA